MGNDTLAAFQIRPESARAYLETHGWRLVPASKSKTYALYAHTEHGLVQMLIPLSMEASDYAECIISVAGKLADIYSESIPMILAAMSGELAAKSGKLSGTIWGACKRSAQ